MQIIMRCLWVFNVQDIPMHFSCTYTAFFSSASFVHWIRFAIIADAVTRMVSLVGREVVEEIWSSISSSLV